MTRSVLAGVMLSVLLGPLGAATAWSAEEAKPDGLAGAKTSGFSVEEAWNELKRQMEAGGTTNHASVATQVKAQSEPLLMRILGDGTIVVEDRSMTLQTLGEYVQNVALKTPDRMVFMESERATAFQHIMFVINVLKTHGLGSVSLAAIEVSPQQPGKPKGKRG